MGAFEPPSIPGSMVTGGQWGAEADSYQLSVPLFEAVSEANGHPTAYASGVRSGGTDESQVRQRGGWQIGEEKDSGKDGDEASEVEVESSKETEKEKDKEKLGKLLSLSAIEATSEWEGHPPLAKGMADSLQDLIEKEGLEGEMIVAAPLGFELLAQWVTRYANIILLLTFGLGFIEMRTPGFGVFGFSSLALFAFFFFGHFRRRETGWDGNGGALCRWHWFDSGRDPRGSGHSFREWWAPVASSLR